MLVKDRLGCNGGGDPSAWRRGVRVELGGVTETWRDGSAALSVVSVGFQGGGGRTGGGVGLLGRRWAHGRWRWGSREAVGARAVASGSRAAVGAREVTSGFRGGGVCRAHVCV